MTDQIDEKICPICGKDNNCMAHLNEPCWCLKVEIPQELIDPIPDNKKNKACICLQCIQEFKVNPVIFRRNL